MQRQFKLILQFFSNFFYYWFSDFQTISDSIVTKINQKDMLLNKSVQTRWKQHKAEVESRTQGSRPRTQKKSEAKDSLSEDRNSRGQGQECSRPRTKDTSASALQIKKKGFHKNFSSDLRKTTFSKTFSSAPRNFNNSKNTAVLKPRTGQFSRT